MKREFSRPAFTALFVALPFAWGCYTYRPLTTPEPQAGTRVSLELTEEGSQDLSGKIGPAVEHLEGEVLRLDTNVVELAVRQVQGVQGWQSDWNGERVSIPRRAVVGWQQRKLSVGGTGFLGGLVAGGMYAIYRLLGGPGLFEGGRGGSGGASR